jgi:hypothetical protein
MAEAELEHEPRFWRRRLRDATAQPIVEGSD